jgi:hypothetical protein
MQQRRSALIVGFTVLGVGLAITIGTYALAAPGGTYIVATGALVVGVWRVARAFAMPPDEVAEAGVDLDDPRWYAKSKGVQIAGKTCAVCEKRIFGQAEGTVCKRCDAIVHRTCLQDHKAHAHAKKTAR